MKYISSNRFNTDRQTASLSVPVGYARLHMFQGRNRMQNSSKSVSRPGVQVADTPATNWLMKVGK